MERENQKKAVAVPFLFTSPSPPSSGHLKFEISSYNATKYTPTTTIECGTATKTLEGMSGSGAAVDSFVFNAQRYIAALNASTGTKNFTAANQLRFSGAHLAATRIGDCLTDRFAAPFVNASALAAKSPLLAKAAANVVSKLKDPVKVRRERENGCVCVWSPNQTFPTPTTTPQQINNTIDAKALDPVFTPRTCKDRINCVPLGVVTIDDSGCQIAREGNRFVFVMDGLPYDSLYCPYAGQVYDVAYQELVSNEPASCVVDNSCEMPPLVPRNDGTFLGAECNVNGVASPCYDSVGGCPPGQVQVTDQAGTCSAGVCCDSPPCTKPNELCGGQCVNTQTTANFCGNCNTACPASSNCIAGECFCPDGQPVQPGPANGTPLKQGKQQGGDQNVLTFDLGTPATNGGTCVANVQCTCTLFYDSYNVPDRFVREFFFFLGRRLQTNQSNHHLPHQPLLSPHSHLSTVRQGGACATVLYDTGFTGSVDSGCQNSAPCCDPAKKPPKGGPGCTGTPGGVCPQGPLFNGQFGGGGTGQGKVDIPISPSNTAQELVVTVFGVCTSTGNAFKLKCCQGAGPCF